MLSTVKRLLLILSEKKKLNWMLKKITDKLWSLLDNRLLTLRLKLRLMLLSGESRHPSQRGLYKNLEHQFQAIVESTEEFKPIMFSVWPMLKPVKWQLRVLVKSKLRRVKLLERLLSGSTDERDDSLLKYDDNLIARTSQLKNNMIQTVNNGEQIRRTLDDH